MCAKKEYEYFKTHFEELYKTYANKYLLINNQSVVDAFDDFDSAAEKGIENFGLGNFLIQQCVPEEKRVSFRARQVSFVSI